MVGRRLLEITLIALAMLASNWARADAADVIGTAGRLGYETGTKGAVTNRQIADQLYKQALEDEKAAWKSFPPNASLLSKALQESKDAKLADDQAKEFARAALHAANTGAKSGQFSNQRYGMIDESKLKELATTNSPYMKQVESTLGGYGMKLSADKMNLQTPFGKFNVNMDGSALEKVLGSVAKKLGFSTAEVSKGLRAAEATRDGIAARTVAALDAQTQKNQAAHANGNGSGFENAKDANRGPASATPGAQDEKVIGSTAGSATVKDFEAQNLPRSLDEIEKELLENRKNLGRSLGMASAADPLGRKHQDIFQMVHVRYQSLRSQGAFIEILRGR